MADTVPDLDAIRARLDVGGWDFYRRASADVPALLAEVERLRAQRDAALALHRDDGWGFCRACITNIPVTGSHAPWPCATATTLTGDATP